MLSIVLWLSTVSTTRQKKTSVSGVNCIACDAINQGVKYSIEASSIDTGMEMNN